MGGSTTISTSETRIEALKLQSSAYGVTIPLVYGANRVPLNLAWYGAFQAVPHTTTTSSGGKGGGVESQNTTFTYTASVVLGICHGPIASIPRAWRGKKVFSGGMSPGQLITVTETYTPPASGAMTYTVSQAATFAAIVSIIGSVAISNYPVTLSRGLDYEVTAGGVVTILNDDWRSLPLSIRYQYISGSVPQTALQQLGLSLVRGNLGQATWSYLATNFASQALGYSGLALLTGQDYDLGTSATVENHNVEVVGPQAYTVSTSTPDADPSTVLLDVLTNGRFGAAFPVQQLDVWTQWSDYCVAAGLLISPAILKQMKAADVIETAGRLTATAPVWSGDRLKMVPYADTAESGNGRTFTPNTTPVYDLTDSHFVPDEGAPPVTVSRKTPADLFNHVRLEFLNRANQYNVEIAEAKDQADIDANGLRSMDVVTAHWICDPVVARKVAQILLQRALYVAAKYSFKLPVNFNLLEPGDLVTLTDPGLGLNLTPVRLTAIDEDGDEGAMAVEAEDYPAGTASSALYPNQAGAGFAHDYNASPGSVNTPFIFEGPGELTVANGLELWIAVRGTGANWGGCRVWVSLDGANYRQCGVSYGGARYGTLTGAISGGVLPVALYGGQLLNGSASDAAALNTLFYIGGSSPEFGSYQTATLTGTLAYNLSGLVRGAYGTSGTAAHAAGDGFARLDDAIVKSGVIDLTYIGRTISFKFTSFNLVGGAEQSLASVPAYTYAVRGANVTGNPAQSGDLALVGTGGVVITGNAAVKATGNNATWDGQCYSRDGFTGGAYATCVLTGKRSMFGLTTDPQATASYASIDWAIYADTSGNDIRAFENGVDAGSIGTWAVGDVLAVVYDGVTVRYMKNGAVLRTVTVTITAPLYFDSSFYDLGDDLSTIRFGPMSAVRNIGTTQLQPSAATDVYTADNVGPVSAVFSGPTSVLTCTVSFTAPVACKLIVSGTMSMFRNGTNKSTVSIQTTGTGVTYVSGQNIQPAVDQSSVAVRSVYNLAAGASVTTSIRLQSSGIAGNSLTAEDISLTAELIKV